MLIILWLQVSIEWLDWTTQLITVPFLSRSFCEKGLSISNSSTGIFTMSRKESLASITSWAYGGLSTFPSYLPFTKSKKKKKHSSTIYPQLTRGKIKVEPNCTSPKKYIKNNSYRYNWLFEPPWFHKVTMPTQKKVGCDSLQPIRISNKIN